MAHRQVRRDHHPPGVPHPPIAFDCTEDQKAREALAVAYTWVWMNVAHVKRDLGYADGWTSCTLLSC